MSLSRWWLCRRQRWCQMKLVKSEGVSCHDDWWGKREAPSPAGIGVGAQKDWMQVLMVKQCSVQSGASRGKAGLIRMLVGLSTRTSKCHLCGAPGGGGHRRTLSPWSTWLELPR
ncbi:uncharacterized protein LOC144065772 isoform X1 [Stigmatopora argus]